MTCSRICTELWGAARLGIAAWLVALSVATSSAQAPPEERATPELKAVREVGRQLFFDPALSASGKLACSSCHDPHYAYAPPNARAVQLGGPDMDRAGTRAAPSLRYTLRRTPIWSAEFEADPIEKLLDLDSNPVGGFDWDGRFDTLHEQAESPLLAANQMANENRAAFVMRLSRARYAPKFEQVFGVDVWSDPERAFTAALQALERFELDDPSFYPFTSRYDEFLDGKAKLSATERRGLALFNAPDKGNCASCHISSVGADGSHPLFTDFAFQNLGVPRNPDLPANRDPTHFDLGLCGPQRTDQASHTAYCGMFKTPTLRNVATRRVFFHNGSFRSLRDVLRFYVARDRVGERWYPQRDGHIDRYDDLPREMRGNVDHFNAPFDRGEHRAPALDAAEIEAVLAFLDTLTDRDAAPPPARNEARAGILPLR